jgi:hypothetical protein
VAVLEMLGNARLRLLFSGSGLSSGVGVFLGEALDTASGVHEFLLASEERVAIGADFDAQHIALNGRAGGKSVPTSTVDGDCVIVGMNTGLHESPFCRGRSAPHPAQAGTTEASLGREATAHYNVEQRFDQICKKGAKKGDGSGAGDYCCDFIGVAAFRAICFDGCDHVIVVAAGLNARVPVVERTNDRVSYTLKRAV